MYNVNINLIYIDGSIKKENQKKLAFGKKTYFAKEENKNLPSINLLYNLNCFFKFYTRQEYKDNINVFKRFTSQIKEIIFEDNEVPCDLCNKKESNNENKNNKNDISNHKKIYFKSQLICACLECLKGKTDAIINSRFFNYQKDGFLSRECN